MIITFPILKEQTFTNVPWIYKASDCVNTDIKHDCYTRSFYFVTLYINTIIYYLINIYICDIICKYQLYLQYEAKYLENSQIEILVSQFKAHVVSFILDIVSCRNLALSVDGLLYIFVFKISHLQIIAKDEKGVLLITTKGN
jgi:hypothetical protein